MVAAPALARPRALRPGATIGVCAPSGPVDEKALGAGIAWLEEQGFAVRCGAHLRASCGYLAGSDAQRLEDLCALVRDPDVAAIVAARGGYGSTRILRGLDADELRRGRKLFIGYSDASALSLHLLRRAGLASVHGPMLERVHTGAARARLLALVRGEPGALEPIRGQPLRAGRVAGPLVGGNLAILTASLGTAWEIDTEGAILFFEEVGEQPYALDRSLVQLREAGKLEGVAGLAVGQLVDCGSERYPEISACDVIREALVRELDVPVVGDLPFGHIADHRALGVGVRAELDGDAGTLALLDPVVEKSD